MVETLNTVAMSARAAGQSYGMYVATCWEQDRRAAMPKRTADDRRLRRHGGRQQERHYTDEDIFTLWKSGLSDKRIGATFGVSRTVIQRWRDHLELPSLTMWPTVDPQGFRLDSDPISGRAMVIYPPGLSPSDFIRK